MTDLLLDTELSVEQVEYLQMVKGSADSLLSIINDILDFSKLEAGKVSLEPLAFDLRKSLGTTMKMFAVRAQEKKLDLILDVDPKVPEAILADPGRLRQILTNLIGNATKFTESGEIEVRVDLEEENGAELVMEFAVRDTGIGIPAEKQALIFGAFTQADSSTTRKYGGTGLGLSIAIQLVQLMGGRLWIESKVAQGSTFHFTIRAERTACEQPSEPPDAAQLVGKTVLIVDDNATNRRILEDSVRRWGMRPVVVASAFAAAGTLLHQKSSGVHVDLLLSDAHMPGLDGFGLVKKIREHRALDPIRVVMLTSSGQKGDAMRCEQLGIEGYLSKPFDRLELREVLLRVLDGPHGAGVSRQLVTRHALLEHTRPLSFLVAEDNVVNQRLITRILEKRGHRAVLVQNGREAIDARHKEQFDAILMDCEMPEMDGLEATARIRAEEQSSGSHIPIIALTAHAMRGDKERCLATGMDGYVSKPVKPEELFTTIETVVASVSGARPSASPASSELQPAKDGH